MTHVRGRHVDGPLVAVEGQGVVAAVLEPEVLVEGLLQGGGLLAEALAEGGVALLGGEVGPGDERPVDVGLHLAERDRAAGGFARGERDGAGAVLPALVGGPAVGGPLVLDVPVAVAVAVLDDPAQRPVGRRQEGVDLVAAGAPPGELAEDHDVQRGGVGRGVGHRPAGERQRGRLAEAGLGQDPARLLLGHRVDLAALEPGQGLQRPQGQVGVEHHGHPRRQQGVAARQRHEPRRPGGHHHPLGVLGVVDPQRGEVDGRPSDERLERLVDHGHPGQAAAPRLEAGPGLGPVDRLAAAVARLDGLAVHHRRDLHADRPGAAGRDDDLPRRDPAVEAGRLREVDPHRARSGCRAASGRPAGRARRSCGRPRRAAGRRAGRGRRRSRRSRRRPPAPPGRTWPRRRSSAASRPRASPGPRSASAGRRRGSPGGWGRRGRARSPGRAGRTRR